MSSLARRLALFGILVALGGIAIVTFAIGESVTQGVTLSHLLVFIIGVATILIGVMFYRPSDNLNRIVTTEGSDIRELMTAMDELCEGFYWLSYVIGGIIVLAIAAVILIAIGG